MGKIYASTKRALAECDRCGFRYKLKDLKKLVIKGKDTNTKVCSECWEKDHPQRHLGEKPIYDPQAIRDPRPDYAGYAASRAHIIAVNSSKIATAMFLNSVNVQTT